MDKFVTAIMFSGRFFTTFKNTKKWLFKMQFFENIKIINGNHKKYKDGLLINSYRHNNYKK